MQNKQTPWTVDLSSCTATHSTGLIVRFVKAADHPHAWDGEATNDDIWFHNLCKKQPAEEVQELMAGLMREAGDIYLEALKRRQ